MGRRTRASGRSTCSRRRRPKDIKPAEVIAGQLIAPEALTVELANGLAVHRERPDAAVAARAEAWTFTRMPVLDLNALRSRLR